jgi:peptidoglycan/LPS O-acetylase OafA/YrhL
MSQDRTKLPERNLDVLRAVAVLCVVLAHLLETLRLSPSVIGITDAQIGRIGVLLFFVHTSLVLMSSLERGGEGEGWVGRFYLRRAFRIYPLAIAVILLTVAFHIPSGRAPVVTPTTGTVLSNLLLVQNLTNSPDVTGNLWTLPIELQMYLLLPALYLIARRSVALVVAALGVSVAAFYFVAYAPIPGLWRLTVTQFGPCFVGGGVLAYAILRRKRRTLPSWTWPLVLAAAIPVFVLLNRSGMLPQNGWPFAIFVGIATPFVREIPASLFHRVTKTIAKYSYGIYLTHGAALGYGFYIARSASPAIQWTIFLVLFVSIPWILYTYVEAPGIALGQRIVNRPMTQAATVGAP